MNIKYDKKVDALYFALSEGKYSDTIKIAEGIMVDKDSDGNILGIEVMDATTNIPAFNPLNIKFNVQTV